MVLTSRTEHDLCILQLKGELDCNSAPLLDEAIKKTLQEGLYLRKLYINCKDLNYISSAGLGVIIDHHSQIKAFHIAFVFYEMQLPVRDIFLLLGLDNYVTIVASEEEAHLFCHKLNLSSY
ncbi:STAS domain-containing protein [Rhodocytophaga aerolata]|uniref:Anti-sigma factor antagonist n=1 Tax=Rhodocytophaga aerolata TaxID=455078 RepID=A0ABT8RF03_9BACT|nr:STAS domain-containing protein [Rhodocytophaga aerolata]MDO1450691.1 STAS domain-containing protein [Rhodocytophaga aerolata]